MAMGTTVTTSNFTYAPLQELCSVYGAPIVSCALQQTIGPHTYDSLKEKALDVCYDNDQVVELTSESIKKVLDNEVLPYIETVSKVCESLFHEANKNLLLDTKERHRLAVSRQPHLGLPRDLFSSYFERLAYKTGSRLSITDHELIGHLGDAERNWVNTNIRHLSADDAFRGLNSRKTPMTSKNPGEVDDFEWSPKFDSRANATVRLAQISPEFASCSSVSEAEITEPVRVQPKQSTT